MRADVTIADLPDRVHLGGLRHQPGVRATDPKATLGSHVAADQLARCSDVAPGTGVGP